MEKIIYYFTGTGNSLVVARDIADLIEADLVSIPQLMKKDKIENKADIIGIVFPVYHQDVPLIVKRFIHKLNNITNSYIFAVCTYGNSPTTSLKILEELIQSNNAQLSAGFAVQMPYNYISPSLNILNFFNSFSLNEYSAARQAKMLTKFKIKQKEIADIVLNKKISEIETEATLIESLIDKLNLRNTLQKYVWLKVAGYRDKAGLSFQSALKYMDHGFKVDDNCNNCELCIKVCPVNNIAIEKGKPYWQHKCEQCFACLQWCPQSAIQFREGTKGQKRYHNPNITLSEILKSNIIKT